MPSHASNTDRRIPSWTRRAAPTPACAHGLHGGARCASLATRPTPRPETEVKRGVGTWARRGSRGAWARSWVEKDRPVNDLSLLLIMARKRGGAGSRSPSSAAVARCSLVVAASALVVTLLNLHDRCYSALLHSPTRAAGYWARNSVRSRHASASVLWPHVLGRLRGAPGQADDSAAPAGPHRRTRRGSRAHSWCPRGHHHHDALGGVPFA